jgi:asparagine synthase (glutamine-hydrolysing)
MPLRNELPDDIKQEITQVLENSVRRNLSDAILLSGGLDTSVLACLAVKWKKPHAITVAFKGAEAVDMKYARIVAANLELEHEYRIFDEEKLEEALRETIKVLKTFDPMEVRNSVSTYVGLEHAQKKGFKTVMTGDGGDELFAGYSFFFDMDKNKLEKSLRRMWKTMSFSSIPLARHLSIEARLPLLDPAFISLAVGIDTNYKVRQEQGRIWGKWCLRKAFSGLLPDEIIWREKAPLEAGTGTAALPDYYNKLISDDEFSTMKEQILNKDGVKIRSKEHLHYYKIYKMLCGVPGQGGSEGKRCPDCNSIVEEGTNFCRTCGAYPI